MNKRTVKRWDIPFLFFYGNVPLTNRKKSGIMNKLSEREAREISQKRLDKVEEV